MSGGDALPAASDKTAVAGGSPEVTDSSTLTNNPWTMNLDWTGPAATTGNVHALQWTPTTGIPTAYRGYGVATGVAVANRGASNSVAIAMTAPVASTISGAVTVPAGVTLAGKVLAIAFADGAAISVGTDATTATSFNYPVPTGIDSTAWGMITGGATITQVSGIAAGSTGTSVNLLAPALQSTPVANATGVSTATDFTWTQLTGGLHFVYLITTGTTGRIPDLGALGVVLPAATSYSWQIIAVGPWASIDDFAGGTGYPARRKHHAQRERRGRSGLHDPVMSAGGARGGTRRSALPAKTACSSSRRRPSVRTCATTSAKGIPRLGRSEPKRIL